MSVVGGLLNYSDITIIGSVDSRGPIMSTRTSKEMAMPGFGMTGLGLMGLGSLGLGTHVIDMTIDIDQFTIGAIRIGNDTTGPSLGSLSIYGLHADVKGTVSIWTH